MILLEHPRLQSVHGKDPEHEAKLEAQLVASGGPERPIRVGVFPDGNEWIVFGHTRYRICRRLGLPFQVVKKQYDSIEAAIEDMCDDEDGGHRQLTTDQKIMIRVQAGAALEGKGFPPDLVTKAREVYAEAPHLAAKVASTNVGIRAVWNGLRKPVKASPTRQRKAPKGRIHVVIGDTQVKPGVPTQHLSWIGRYIADQFVGQDVALIHLGDHWDMPSLSSYDQGKKAIEGKRYVEDVQAGNAAFALLDEPIAKVTGRWKPEKHFLLGNHEDRITRACNDAAHLDGKLSLDDLDTRGWQRHTFREVVDIDGISYSHYFYNANTGRPLSGENLYPRLKTIGRSFTMGHQQGLQYVLRPVGLRRQHGLVLGSTYLHEEEYLGPQVTAYWRGIVVKHQVEDGQYDPMFVSLDYLCRRYEGKTLADFMRGLV